ncbi:Phosphoserine phosphatase [hydrothermal vent metagenome]|uniref:phosphoserine phosphatase n=1 Tax=hydrothermal vent metagenome TaxID=652676 RepID=A0A3B0TMJ4_9ZZZZ
MTTYALTLITNLDHGPLTEQHVDMVCARLNIVCKPDWLAKNEACELIFCSDLSAMQITVEGQKTLQGTAIDAVCTLAKSRRKKLLVCDMDSTIIDQECIDEIGDAIGQGAEIREITAKVINGTMNFSKALRRRVALLKGLEVLALEKVYNERISIKNGARTLVQTMRKNGAHCVLVSGGFTYFTSRIAKSIGFHDHQANELLVEAGKLTGVVKEPILGRSAKLSILQSLCTKNGLAMSEILTVGDGANDIEMIKAAGLGVAFHGSKLLCEQAKAAINHADLTALLYIQGFKKSEFVYS